MQSPRVRASSPRPLTRRSSKRELPSPLSRSSKSASSFHLPPVSPTTPISPSSQLANVHSPISPSFPQLTTQLSTPTSTPPPTPAPSPTASRPTRHLSFRRRQSDLIRMTSDLPRKQSDLNGKQSSLTRMQSDVTRRPSDLTRRPSDLTSKQSNLSRKHSGLARKQSGLTRRQSRRQGQGQSSDTSLTTPQPEPPRRVRFGADYVEYLAGDSSDEEEDFFCDPELDSRPTVTSSRPKDLEDSRGRAREILGHDRPRDLIAVRDNDASRKGRSSNRGPPGKRSATPFVRRGDSLDDEGDDEEGDNDAEENRVRHGNRSDTDESAFMKQTRSIDRDDEPTSMRGRSSSRGAPPKRSATPFVKRSVSWEDEDKDDEDNDKDSNEKNGIVIVNAGSEERSNDDGAIRKVRSGNVSDDEPSLSRRGRSSSRSSPSRRSPTPFAKRNVDWEGEDEEDGRKDAEPESANRGDNNAQCSPRDRIAENDGERDVRRGRSVSENDDEPPPTRGRSSNRGARTKRSATPFVKRNIYWADEDDHDGEENDALPASAKGKENGIAQASNDILPDSRSFDREGEKMEMVERLGLAVIQEIEESVTILEDEDEPNIGQQGSGAVQNNGTDTTEHQEETQHQRTILEKGDLQVLVPCSCGQAQILTYSPLTGIDLKPW